MKKSPIFVDFSLLRLNPHFRSIFIARMISVFAFGILMVAVPVQIHQLTGSTLQVGAAMALDGIGMFAGLMCGGVLADRMDRRRLILLGRTSCGLGFLALALNGFMTNPSVTALYVVSTWDGFFSGIGITSLMASIPVIVGRENLPAAGALSMLTVRFGAVLSPLLGGLIITAAGVNWNYLLAGIGTLATLIPLTRLPSLKPQNAEPSHPLRSLMEGFEFLWQNKVVGAVVAVGTLQTLLSAVRVLYPSLAEDGYGGGAFEVGLMYSAVPLGAMLGAFTEPSRRDDAGLRDRLVAGHRVLGRFHPSGLRLGGAGGAGLSGLHCLAAAVHAGAGPDAGPPFGPRQQSVERPGRGGRQPGRAGSGRAGAGTGAADGGGLVRRRRGGRRPAC
ncbi:enterobactin transporter EntS [Chromobacterium piscinae]|uniref:enterobactin transporter EntS n=1 Tax=Chromobacterium piscinae TaxID=686831 RepID=UPI0031FC69AA